MADKATKKTTAKADDSMANRITDGARDFVKKSTASAKERTDGMYDSAKKYNADMESLMVRAAKGYAGILGNLAEVTYSNVNRGLAAAEKLAEAKSLSDAWQVQVDYVRDQHNTNVENVRSAFEYTRDVVSENASDLRETASKMWNSEKAA